MAIRLFNTLSNKIEEFVPHDPNNVLFYSCGPTVYAYPHIGNWAAYIYWDTLIRLLDANNFKINRVMNITDVGHLVSDADEGEDKLEKGAKREGKTAWEIAQFYTDDFITGLNELNLIMPDHLARATDYIPQQLDLIKKLKDKGFTYQIEDGIYFDTAKFPEYADFAHLNLDELKAGARVEFNQEKRNISDFALWKFTPKNHIRDMQWPTPPDILDHKQSEQIMGFPGWHIECSAISMSLLGETLDIHTGGIDHIPVHHTNEIAQSEAATGKKFCNFWLHNDFVKIDGKKVSKSLGNFYTLNDLKEKGFNPLDFRMFVLQGHYQNEGNFTFEGLTAAKNRLNNWRNIAVLRHQIHDSLSEEDNQKEVVPSFALSKKLVEILNNNLATPEALKSIDEAFSEISNTNLDKINRSSLMQLLESIDRLLGLKLIESTPDIEDDLKRMIIERNMARKNLDWKKSDDIRDKLIAKDVILKDNQNETIWEYKL